jgi:hypothetical protein
MALDIDADRMTSEETAHFAVPTPDGSGWSVSWLPGQILGRDQAITALTLAEVVATTELWCDSPWWPFIDEWAAELGLTGPNAILRAAGSPGDANGTGW